MHAALGEEVDAGRIGEGLEETDQHLSLSEPAHLLGRRLAYLDDGVGVPDGSIERGSCLGVRVVGEGCRHAGALLDDDVETTLRKA